MIAVFGVKTLQKDNAKLAILKKKFDFTYLKEIMTENKTHSSTLLYASLPVFNVDCILQAIVALPSSIKMIQ